MTGPKSNPNSAERILRIKEILAITGMGRTSIHELRKAGRFPTPVKLGARAIGWTESSIDRWIADLPKLAK